MRVQATAALAGAGVLFAWRGGPVAAAVLAIAALLAVLAWASPRGYEPVQRALDRLVQWILTGVTWVLLSLVFIVIFVPGRLLLGRTRRRRSRNKNADTFWRNCRKVPAPASFGRQF